jgi:ribosome-binding protein aMBF1 (putative translation factor)
LKKGGVIKMESELSFLELLFEEHCEYEDEVERKREEEEKKKEEEARLAREAEEKRILAKVGLDGYPKKMKVTREALGMNQKELARLWKVETVAIRNWESGRVPVPARLIYDLMERKEKINLV